MICVICGARAYSQYCVKHKPHKQIDRVKRPRPAGKVQTATNKAVAEWKANQKPNHEGYYQCYICGRWVDYLMAEHVKSKARSPESRTDHNNLKPVCARCNKAKGSKSFA